MKADFICRVGSCLAIKRHQNASGKSPGTGEFEAVPTGITCSRPDLILQKVPDQAGVNRCFSESGRSQTNFIVPLSNGLGLNSVPVGCYIPVLTGTIPRLLLRLCRSKLLISKENHEYEDLESTNLACYITFF